MKNFLLTVLFSLLLILVTISSISCVTIVTPQSSDSPNIPQVDINPSQDGTNQGIQGIVVSYFVANPSVIGSGSSSELRWQVTGATAVQIDQGIGNVGLSGNIMVYPVETTTYRLTASNSSYSVIAVTQVSVTSASPVPTPAPTPSNLPVIHVFNAEPQNIMAGESSIISWNVSNANSVTIIPTIVRNLSGSVDATGSITVTPSITTAYILTATNPNSSITQSITIVVTPESISPQYSGWTGTWETDWGTMQLVQASGKVTGTYTWDQGKIIGYISKNMSGDILVGTWSEEPSYSPPNDAGDIEFIMAPDFNSFTGNWRYGSEGEWDGSWVGTRVNP